MPLLSMTGFAARRGSWGGSAWAWELRGVNGKGLDLRIRLPEGYDALDPIIRSECRKHVQRGSLAISLKVTAPGIVGGLVVSEAGLASAIAALKRAEEAAMEAGLDLAPLNAASILAQRGVLETSDSSDEPDIAQIAKDLPALFKDFNAMRGSEGKALAQVLDGQIARMATLAAAAAATLEARAARSGEVLRQRLAQLLDASERPDEARLAQELALLAVKSDVSEELDRLEAHIAAARDLLKNGDAVGRRLDFLMQEFNREANTLCSKSSSTELTTIGLDLKAVIDQAREQVQNVE